MSTRLVLTGPLPLVVVVAALLSLPLCLLLLHWYRKAVIAGMKISSGHEPIREPNAPRGVPLDAPGVEELSADSTAHALDIDTVSRERAAHGPWRCAGVYTSAGLAYAVVMTGGWLLATRDSVLAATKLAVLSWTYLWPTVLAVLLVAAYDRNRRSLVMGTYFGVFGVLTTLSSMRNPDLGLMQVPFFWVLVNGPATALLMTFLARPIRAVGPLVLVFMLMVTLGSQALLAVVANSEATLRAVGGLGFQLGLTAGGVFAGMVLIGIGAFAALGWPLLHLIGRRYQAKAFSDQSMTIDSLFLLFAVVQSIGLAFDRAAWAFSGLAAFVVYKLVARAGFRRVRAQPGSPRTLLLLRVFRLGKRSEQLFDKIRKHWQSIGSIAMIAGPDIVTGTVEPHDFLQFVSGRLGRQFVTGAVDLERRLAAMDRLADPDGRYRINEFFCRTDTWQITMQRLASASDRVLMDLRSFNASNDGCLFELGCLLDGIRLDRVVLLIDDTTDRPYLEAILGRLWSCLSATSPNRIAPAPRVRIFHIGAQTEQTIMTLLEHVLARLPGVSSSR